MFTPFTLFLLTVQLCQQIVWIAFLSSLNTYCLSNNVAESSILYYIKLHETKANNLHHFGLNLVDQITSKF